MNDRTIRIITLIIGSILAILLFNFVIGTIPAGSSSELPSIPLTTLIEIYDK